MSTWCKRAWASITADTVKTCFKICGLTLALDGSEDHDWCVHNFGAGYRELLQQQRVEWEEAHPGVSLPPLRLPDKPAGDAAKENLITPAQEEVDATLLPTGEVEDSDVELL